MKNKLILIFVLLAIIAVLVVKQKQKGSSEFVAPATIETFVIQSYSAAFGQRLYDYILNQDGGLVGEFNNKKLRVDASSQDITEIRKLIENINFSEIKIKDDNDRLGDSTYTFSLKINNLPTLFLNDCANKYTCDLSRELSNIVGGAIKRTQE